MRARDKLRRRRRRRSQKARLEHLERLLAIQHGEINALRARLYVLECVCEVRL